MLHRFAVIDGVMKSSNFSQISVHSSNYFLGV